jgi:hypothetical protein
MVLGKGERGLMGQEPASAIMLVAVICSEGVHRIANVQHLWRALHT